MRAATASIVHEDAYQAGRDTAAEILDQLHPDVVVVFSTSRHDPQKVLDGLWSRLPEQTRLLGCSCFAEIETEDVLLGSVTVMGLSFDKVETQLFKIDHVSGSSLEAGKMLGKQIEDFEPKVVMVLPDGMTINNAKLVRGLQESLGQQCPIIGGVASEQLEFTQTFEFYDREVLTGGIVALALRGPLTVATVAKAGFQPVGATRTCTRVENDNLILELDGESALELYKQFLGPEIIQRPSIGTEFPLAVIASPGSDYMGSDEQAQVIRVVRNLDETRGALLCGGDVYTGSKIRMTRATKTDLIDAATLAMEEVKRAMPNPRLGFVFNCAGRKRILGARYQDEIRAAHAALGMDIPTVGFYTYGEIAPVNGKVMHHAETFTAALLGVS